MARKKAEVTSTPQTPPTTSPSKSEDSGLTKYFLLGGAGAMLGGPLGLAAGLWIAHKIKED